MTQFADWRTRSKQFSDLYGIFDEAHIAAIDAACKAAFMCGYRDGRKDEENMNQTSCNEPDLETDYFYYVAEKCGADISMSHPQDGGTVWFNTAEFEQFCRSLHSHIGSTFKMGDRVRKKSGSEWQGRIVGWYSTILTQEGYAVESESHAGSVQIYPAKVLEKVE